MDSAYNQKKLGAEIGLLLNNIQSRNCQSDFHARIVHIAIRNGLGFIAFSNKIFDIEFVVNKKND